MKLRNTLTWILIALGLSACGGGGVDGSGDVVADMPELAQDSLPTGARIDVSAKNYFPAHTGDSWVYEKIIDGSMDSWVTRRVTSGPDELGTYVISEQGTSDLDYTTYRKTPEGLTSIDPFQPTNDWPGLGAAMPTWVEFPTPLYPAGSKVRTIRQGDLQTDLDGDGRNDRFRIEITQVFVGFDSIDVLGKSTQVAHFRNSVSLTIGTTKDNKKATTSGVEDAYLADGLGLVRARRSGTSPDGSPLFTTHTLTLRSAKVDDWKFTTSGDFRNIPLYYRDVVYDPTRGVYYASISYLNTSQNDRIATINAASGHVTYSRTVGMNPGALDVAPDGSVLYVALGTGEILELALPAMTELRRLRLPESLTDGQYIAEAIRVSPTSSDVFAVSIARTGWLPRHMGVALVRDMVLQPRQTQAGAGSNRIAFDASGASLYGYSNETGLDHGLRRIEVLSDGLIERNVVLTGSVADHLDVRDGFATVGNHIYRADASLAFLGEVPNAKSCTKIPSVPKFACQSFLNSNELIIVDDTTFAPIATAAFSDTGYLSNQWIMLPGSTPGQVAIGEAAGRVVLFRSDLLK